MVEKCGNVNTRELAWMTNKTVIRPAAQHDLESWSTTKCDDEHLCVKSGIFFFFIYLRENNKSEESELSEKSLVCTQNC